MVGLFRGRRAVWISLAIALALTGALLVVLSIPGMTSRVAAHEEVVFGGDPVLIGPYDLDEGTYYIWIEDYFPGFDDGEIFEVGASSEGGVFEDWWTMGDYTTRTIEGVDCEHAMGFDDMPEGSWTFQIWTYGETTEGNAIHVFIVKEYDYGPVLMLGVGVVCLTLGLIMTGLLMRGRGRE